MNCGKPVSINHTASALVLLLAFGVLVPTVRGQANVTGTWSTLSYTMPINPIHTALLANGEILVVAGSGNCAPGQSGCPSGPPYGPSNGSGALLVNPFTGAITQFSVSWDMFCNGMVLLPDGRALINGGTIQYDPFYGALASSIFDPSTNTFSTVPNMAHGRWYPTLLTLGDGQIMTFSGTNETGVTNNAVEIYTEGSGWSTQYIASWTPPLYPRLHLLPDGQVFYSGSTTSSALFNPSTDSWTLNVASTNYCCSRTYGSSVLLPLTPANNYDPKIIIMGGNSPATNTTEIIDLGASDPAWVYGPNMSEARIEMNAVILPNGQILAVGGSVNDEDTSTLSLNADLYNPATNTFSSAGANASERLYHSVALLLPDATVWLAGGNPERGTYNNTVESYQPAYLFNADGSLATRPTITAAPGSITYGNNFSVTTPNAASISSVVLVRNGTVTHAFGMDQREVGLSFTAGNGTLTVTAPPNGNIAPPGYYMLFLLNSSGVPSLASFVLVANQIPTPPTNLVATPGNVQVGLSWSASSFATSYNVQRSTTSGGPYTTIASPTTTSYTDTGVTNGTTYYYVVAAVNSAGQSANSSQVSATPQLVVPPPPTNLVATAGNGQVGLSWNASNEATSYSVQRSTTSGGPYTAIASPTTTSYTDTGVTNGTTYYYVVAAVNTAGQSANSSQVSATPTAFLINYGSGFSSSSGLQLNGSTTLSGTRLRLTNGESGESSSAFYTTSVNVQSFTTNFSFQMTDAQADGMAFVIQNGAATALGQGGGGLGYEGIGNSVAVKFDIFSNAGEGTDSTGMYENGAAPTVPAVDMTSSGVVLLSEDVMNAELSYNGTTLTLSITDATTNANFTTNWTVNIPAEVGSTTALVGFTGGSGGETAIQDVLGWTYSTSSDSGPPPVPTNLLATAGNAQVGLSWSASVGATSYNVQRSTTSGGPYTTIGTPTTNSYTDTGVTNGTTYYYVVAAVNAAGQSANSSQVSATPQLAIPPVPTNLVATPGNAQVGLTWNASSGATSYNVQRSMTSIDNNGYVTIGTPTTNSFTDLGVANGTTYYYEVAAVNTAGQSANSSPVNATPEPPGIPPVPTNLVATAGNAQVGLSWSTSSGATSYSVQRSTTSGGPYTTVGSPTTTSYTDTGVTNGTTYYYVVAAVNTAGESANSSQVSATPTAFLINYGSGFSSSSGLQLNGSTTLSGTRLRLTNGQSGESSSAFYTTPVNVQSFTTNFSFQMTDAQADGMAFVIQNGAATSLGQGGGGLGYEDIGNSVAVKFDIYSNAGEGTDSTGMYENGATPTVPAVDMTSSGVVLLSGDVMNVQLSYNGTTLTLTITDATTSAKFTTSWTVNIPTEVGSTTALVGFTGGSGGDTAIQDVLSWTYNTGSNTTPPPAPTNLVATAGNAQVGLTWSASSGATSYNVQRSTTSGGPYATIASPTTTSYTDTAVTNGTTYYYVVSAVNTAGQSANSSQVSATPQLAIPPVPTNVVATAGNAQVGLSWSASSGATSYNVKRSTTSGGPYTSIATPSTTSYTDTGVTNGTTYYYVVAAVNTAGQSANSSQVSATPQVGIPPVPTNLVATAGNAQVGLSWSASSGATSYNVQRSTTSGGPYTTIGSPTTTSYTDTGVTNGTTYYYVVAAVNTAGQSANSSQVSATPMGVPPAPTNLVATPGNAQVGLSWSASSGATSYNVKRSTTSGGPYTTIGSPTTTSYTDTGVTNGTTYYYVVAAVNTAGQSANSSQVSATPQLAVPPTPTNLVATAGNAQVGLNWSASSGATSYSVQRSTTSGGPYTTIGSPTTTSYTDTGVTNGTTYYYVVAAVNTAGQSANSSQVSATPTAFLINYGSGFSSSSGLQLNGSTTLSGSRLRLTNGQSGESSSAFYTTPVNVQSFTTNFSFQMTDAQADGMAFVIQNGAATALGLGGGGLGYEDIGNSVAVKFDIFSNAGEGTDSTGMYENGAAPTVPAVDMTSSGVVLLSGDVMNVQLSYNGTTLGLSITDATTNANFTTSWTVNIPTEVGSTTALVGFTGGSGGDTAIQDVLSWTYNTGSNTNPPPAPTNLVATPGNAQVGLSWSASSGATSYNVQRSTTSGGPYTTIGSPTTNSYTDTGVTNGTTYYYVVSAVNTAGQSANSSQVSATPQVGIPPAPTNLVATPGNAQVGLSWSASSGATSYNVKRSTTSGGPYTTIGSPTTTSYTDTGVTNGTTYYYVVAAVNATGQSANSSQVSATPLGVPPAPTNLVATAGNGQVGLSWSASSGATSYNVQRSTTSGGPYTTIGSPTTTSYTDTAVTNGTTYYYVVAAVNTAGQSANSSQVSATPQLAIPPVPTNLIATAGNAQVGLSWSASSGATSYNVKRSTTSGGPYTTIGSPTTTSYTDTGVTNGTTYYYVVAAVNTAGQSGNSSQVSATPTAFLINYGSGFSSSSGLQLNGSTTLSGTRLRLTNGGGGEASSAFYTTPVNVQTFTTNFSFQMTDADADGMAFVIQNGAATALGLGGGGLGYEDIGNSVAVKFDIYSNAGEGTDSTGMYENGAAPTVPAVDMTSSGVVPLSGDVMNVQLSYNGTVLTLSITDATTNANFTTNWTVNIPTEVGSTTALVGFTGGTGGLTSIQDVLSWTFN